MERKTVSFLTEAPYIQIGTLGPDTKNVWLVFHGYGQLSKYFIEKFRLLNQERGDVVIAPQGLSKFYLKSFYGKVGANWMTKDEREHDIELNNRYLNELYKILQEQIHDNVKVNILGFSQGTATASRWIAQNHIKHHLFVMWAGFFASEIIETRNLSSFSDKHTHVFISDTDGLITEEKRQEMKQYLSRSHFNAIIHDYKGGHKIPIECVPALMNLNVG